MTKEKEGEEAFEASGDYEQTFRINQTHNTWEEEHDSKFHNKYELEEIEEQQYQREILKEELYGETEYDPDIDPSWPEDVTPEDKEALKSLFQKGAL